MINSDEYWLRLIFSIRKIDTSDDIQICKIVSLIDIKSLQLNRLTNYNINIL